MKHWLQLFVSGRNSLSYLLLLIMLITVAYGLSESVLNIDHLLLSILAIIGLSCGWLCSASPLKDWHVALLTLFLGIIGSIYYYAQLIKPLRALFNAIWNIAGGVFTRSTEGPPDISSIILALQQLNAQLGTFFNRIIQWGEAIRAGQVGHDKLIIIMLWGLAFWFTTVWAGWSVFRHHSALIAVLPACAMLAGSLNYVAGNPLYLVPLIGTALILIAVIGYDQQEQYWVNHNIDYAEDIRLDMSIAILLLSLGFMVASIIVPSVSFQQIIRTSQKLTQRYQVRVDSIAKSLGLVPQSQVANSFDSFRSPDLPRSHLLGSGPEISKNVVMVIETGDYPPLPSVDSLTIEPPHYYWRSTTYDIYTGHGWATSSIDITNYSSNQPAIKGFLPTSGTIRLVHQSVLLTQDLGGLLYSAGQLISVDKDYQVAWRLSPVDKPDSANKEKVADEFGATIDGNSYKVDSYINTVGLTQLRSASGITPSWIQNRYLALPASLPDRVRQLAFKLTENQLSEYDQAAAIESYLRTITYTLDLPFPPSDRDVVDYFLFDLKRGYCDYYASAMVVMARAIGLPARLITGYATGIYDPVNARYIVTEANAHSWVEVYLAGIGWVEFEPTGGLQAITRLNEPANHVEIPQISQVQHFNLYKWFRTINQNWLAILGGMIGTLLFGMVLWVGSDRWRLRHLSPPMTILQLYRRLYRSGQRLAEQFQIGDTPDEYAIRLKLRLKMLGLAHRWNFYFQRGIEETARLTNLYTQVVYSPHAPALDDQKTAINIWFHLRMRLWLAAKLGILSQLSSKIKSVIKR